MPPSAATVHYQGIDPGRFQVGSEDYSQEVPIAIELGRGTGVSAGGTRGLRRGGASAMNPVVRPPMVMLRSEGRGNRATGVYPVGDGRLSAAGGR